MKVRTRLLSVLLPAAVALAGCEGGTTGPGEEETRFVSAQYTLARVSGKPLPAFYYDSGDTRGDYTGGSLQLNLDGTFAGDYTIHYSRYRNGSPHDWTIGMAGTYEIQDGAIEYRVEQLTGISASLPPLRGVIGGDSVTILTHATEVATYVRQP
ncbi:MAG TPA: hypothetical protein VHG51_07155 [Longimicrobiaceae bacterium]|nr:hypothetical protein [Longimicrobiaceae bacterium]